MVSASSLVRQSGPTRYREVVLTSSRRSNYFTLSNTLTEHYPYPAAIGANKNRREWQSPFAPIVPGVLRG